MATSHDGVQAWYGGRCVPARDAGRRLDIRRYAEHGVRQRERRSQMAKYLFQGSYTVEGLRGVLREGGTKRRETVNQSVQALGGTLETFYYAYGGDDFFIIADVPDSVTATALSLVLNATGAVQFKTIVLITPEEVDAAVRKTVTYRPPGQ